MENPEGPTCQADGGSAAKWRNSDNVEGGRPSTTQHKSLKVDESALAAAPRARRRWLAVSITGQIKVKANKLQTKLTRDRLHKSFLFWQAVPRAYKSHMSNAERLTEIFRELRDVVWACSFPDAPS